MERKTPARSGVFVCMTTLCKTSITGRIFRSTVSKLSTRDVTDTDTRTHQTLFRRQQQREREGKWEQTEIYWTPEITATGYEVSFFLPDPLTGDVFVQLFFSTPGRIQPKRHITGIGEGGLKRASQEATRMKKSAMKMNQTRLTVRKAHQSHRG